MTTLDLFHERLERWLVDLEFVLARHPHQALSERLTTLRAVLTLLKRDQDRAELFATAIGGVTKNAALQRQDDAEALLLDLGQVDFLFSLQNLLSQVERDGDHIDRVVAVRRGGMVDGWIDLFCCWSGATDFVFHARRSAKRWLVADMVNNRRCDRLMAFVLQFTDPAELQAMVAELQKSIAAAAKGVARA